MWRLVILSIIQSVLLCGGQVLLKFALQRLPEFCWTRDFWTSLLFNWHFVLSGITFGTGSVLWMYILKNYPLSMAYPMISLSYVFGMISAIIFFNEDVSLTRWIGVFLIMTGCCLVAK